MAVAVTPEPTASNRRVVRYMGARAALCGAGQEPDLAFVSVRLGAVSRRFGCNLRRRLSLHWSPSPVVQGSHPERPLWMRPGPVRPCIIRVQK